MEDKERVEAYISLYKQQMDRFSKTQDIEWKGNFGIWALLAGAIYLAAKEPINIPLSVAGIVLIVLVLVHLGWLSAVHYSERCDKRFWVEYRRRTLDIIQPNHGEPPFKYSWIREAFWILLEAGMTLILGGLLFAILIWRAGL